MNVSSEELLYIWNLEESRKYMFHDVFLILYFVIGCVGNFCVILVYLTRLRNKSDSRYFIPILAVADFFACALRVSFDLWKNFLPVNFQNILGCQIVWLLVNIFTFVSVNLLATITLQRYRKVCRPNGIQLTKRIRQILLVVIAFLAISLSAPFIIWNEKLSIPHPVYGFNVTGYICGANVVKIDDNSHSFFGFITFVSIVLVAVMVELIVLNSLIARKIYIMLKNSKARKHKNVLVNTGSCTDKSGTSVSVINSTDCSMASVPEVKVVDGSKSDKPLNRPPATFEVEEQETDEETNAGKQKSREAASSRRFSYMFMVIGFAFILSYLPQICLLFSLIHDRLFWIKNTKVETIVYKFFDQIIAVNNIVNPYVYGYFDLKFKREFRKLFSCN